MFPADEFGDRELIAVGFELQAAQRVGDLAAELAGMNRVAPQFGERRFGERCRLVLAQCAGDFGLATGNQYDESGFLAQREADRVVGRRVAGVQRGDEVDAGRQFG